METNVNTNTEPQHDTKLPVMPSLPLELIEWWEGFRPENWDIIQHLHNPCINCPTEREQKLAFWISRRLLGNEAQRTLGVSFRKGLRGTSCQNTPTLERITYLENCTNTIIDDTLCQQLAFIQTLKYSLGRAL